MNNNSLFYPICYARINEGHLKRHQLKCNSSKLTKLLKKKKLSICLKQYFEQ